MRKRHPLLKHAAYSHSPLHVLIVALLFITANQRNHIWLYYAATRPHSPTSSPEIKKAKLN
jgi:hypothetical protein